MLGLDYRAGGHRDVLGTRLKAAVWARCSTFKSLRVIWHARRSIVLRLDATSVIREIVGAAWTISRLTSHVTGAVRCICLSAAWISVWLRRPRICVLNSRIEDASFRSPDLLAPSILFYQVCTASLSWVELTLLRPCVIWMARRLWVRNLAGIGVIVFLDLLGDSSTTQKWVVFSRFLGSVVLLLLRELLFGSCASLEVLAGREGVSPKIGRRSRSWTAHVSTFMNVLLEAFLISLLIGRLLSPSLLHRDLLCLMVIIDSVSARLVDWGHPIGAKHPFL